MRASGDLDSFEAGTFLSDAASYPLDWPALGAWLKRQGHVLDAEETPRQFSSGVGNFNYLVRVNGTYAVLRRPPPGPRPPGANDMAREFRVLCALNPHIGIVPQALALCEDVEVLGAPFMLSEYRNGRVIRGDQFDGDATTCRNVGLMMIGLLADLHKLDVGAVGLTELGKPQGFAARTAQGWRKRAMVATDGDCSVALLSVADWLDANAPADSANPTLLHNDFKLDNIIVEPGLPSMPKAILDWDQATIGEPLFDLATLLSYWASPSDPPVMLAVKQMPTAREGFLTRREVVDAYAKSSGLDTGNIVYFRALAQFKLAVVALQLHARWRAAPSKFPYFAAFDQASAGMINFTRDIIDQRIF